MPRRFHREPCPRTRKRLAECSRSWRRLTKKTSRLTTKTSPSKSSFSFVAECRASYGLRSGIGVSAETSRRIACDASIIEMKHDEKGDVLDVGRKTRKIPPAIRRALDARDPTCVWPGCHSKFVQGHHLEFWAEGGETKLPNLCNLCSYHHHLVHDGDYRVEMLADGKFRVTHSRGMGDTGSSSTCETTRQTAYRHRARRLGRRTEVGLRSDRLAARDRYDVAPEELTITGRCRTASCT